MCCHQPLVIHCVIRMLHLLYYFAIEVYVRTWDLMLPDKHIFISFNKLRLPYGLALSTVIKTSSPGFMSSSVKFDSHMDTVDLRTVVRLLRVNSDWFVVTFEMFHADKLIVQLG